MYEMIDAKNKVGKRKIIWQIEKWEFFPVQGDMESFCHSWELNPNVWISTPIQEWQ